MVCRSVLISPFALWSKGKVGMLECGLLAKRTLVYNKQKGTNGPWEAGREKCRSCTWDGVSHCPGAGLGLAGWEWLYREGAVLQGETAWFM